MPPNELDDLRKRLDELEHPERADTLVEALKLILGKTPMVYALAGGLVLLCLSIASYSGIVVDLVAILKTVGALMSCVV